MLRTVPTWLLCHWPLRVLCAWSFRAKLHAITLALNGLALILFQSVDVDWLLPYGIVRFALGALAAEWAYKEFRREVTAEVRRQCGGAEQDALSILVVANGAEAIRQHFARLRAEQATQDRQHTPGVASGQDCEASQEHPEDREHPR